MVGDLKLAFSKTNTGREFAVPSDLEDKVKKGFDFLACRFAHAKEVLP